MREMHFVRLISGWSPTGPACTDQMQNLQAILASPVGLVLVLWFCAWQHCDVGVRLEYRLDYGPNLFSNYPEHTMRQ